MLTPESPHKLTESHTTGGTLLGGAKSIRRGRRVREDNGGNEWAKFIIHTHEPVKE